MKRWRKRVPGRNIFELNKLFFPVNVRWDRDNPYVKGDHWVCVVVSIKEQRVNYYDCQPLDAILARRAPTDGSQTTSKYMEGGE